jgi:hypothetical protein
VQCDRSGGGTSPGDASRSLSFMVAASRDDRARHSLWPAMPSAGGGVSWFRSGAAASVVSSAVWTVRHARVRMKGNSTSIFHVRSAGCPPACLQRRAWRPGCGGFPFGRGVRGEAGKWRWQPPPLRFPPVADSLPSAHLDGSVFFDRKWPMAADSGQTAPDPPIRGVLAKEMPSLPEGVGAVPRYSSMSGTMKCRPRSRRPRRRRESAISDSDTTGRSRSARSSLDLCLR